MIVQTNLNGIIVVFFEGFYHMIDIDTTKDL